MQSLDSETTGVDLHHEVDPFIVTFCNEQWENTWFEWEVDPLTREVQIVKEDVEEIVSLIEDSDLLILQNAKFDVTVLIKVIRRWFPKFVWPWKKTKDTLIAGHLLASNHPHDLESMSVEFLGVDPRAIEERMRLVVEQCRRLVRRKNSPIANWRIAKEGLPEMPSATEKVWKFDLWLPKAVKRFIIEEEAMKGVRHFPELDLEALETVTTDYANSDSATTLGVWKVQEKRIERRNLGKIFENRMKVVYPIELMQRNGVTANGDRLEELDAQYKEESIKYGNLCTGIASTFDYELTLPKGGNNKSLTTFAFDVLNLPAVKRSPKTGEPSLDKKVIEAYQILLPARSKQLHFVNNLAAKRKRDTSIAYMESYKRFWLVLKEAGYYRLHPSINPTGTDTLRMSSSNPNEQNISKQGMFEGDKRTIRYLFGPLPEREWWSLDAKNIELRIPAYESKEQELIDLFERPDEPPYYGSTHLLNFHTVYPDFWEDVYNSLVKALGSKDEAWAKVGPTCKKKFAATWYQYCKNGGFAVQYGAVERENGTADQAFHREGSHARLKERFSRLEGLNEYWIDYAERNAYVETMPDKFVDPERGYPLLCTRDNWGRIKPTVPLNYHVQGTAMWWMCQAMISCQSQLDEWRESEGFTGFITMQVHDELVFDFPRGRGSRPWLTNRDKIERLAELMALGGEGIGVPTPVGIEFHPSNWGEGVTLR
jgi:DNA polymerase I-like protein with 3'-5' exonuclease and polymerase domains